MIMKQLLRLVKKIKNIVMMSEEAYNNMMEYATYGKSNKL